MTKWILEAPYNTTLEIKKLLVVEQIEFNMDSQKKEVILREATYEDI